MAKIETPFRKDVPLLLVKVGKHMWGGTIQSSKANRVVSNHFDAVPRWGKAMKMLINPHAASWLKMREAFKAVHAAWRKSTLPWTIDGHRIFQAKGENSLDEMRDLVSQLDELIRQAEQAREEFFRAYPELMLQRKKEHGDLFDESHYPSLDDLRAKISLEVSTKVLAPAKGD
jgi:hypothetical protein